MNKGDSIDLAIERVVYRGSGLARYDGRVVFVPGVLPGEKVKAVVSRVKKSFAEGRVLEILEGSPDRIPPVCQLPQDPLITVPGCVYGHVKYPAEVALKEVQLREQMERFGGISELTLEESVHSPASLHYRNKIALHSVTDGKILGYVGEDNRTVLDIPACPLAVDPINALLKTLRGDSEFRERIKRRSTVTLRWTETDGALFWIGKPEVGSPTLTQETPVGTLQVSRRSFFQVNDPVAASLINAVSAKLEELSPECVVDLYCGVGVFSFAAAKAHATHVLGIESDTQAVRVAERNGESLGLSTEFAAGKCADFADSALDSVRGKGATVIVDPPRSGLDPAVVKALLKHPPKHLLYISCSPDTLGRDLKILCNGGFRVENARIFDMFPRTAHFETMVWLTR